MQALEPLYDANWDKTATLKHVHYNSVAKSGVRVSGNTSKPVKILRLVQEFWANFKIPQVPLWDRLPGRLQHSPSTGPTGLQQRSSDMWKMIGLDSLILPDHLIKAMILVGSRGSKNNGFFL